MSEIENDKTNKRRFWQIHLSTAITLMFCATSLTFLNVMSKFSLEGEEIPKSPAIFGSFKCGWPFTVWKRDAYLLRRMSYLEFVGELKRVQTDSHLKIPLENECIVIPELGLVVPRTDYNINYLGLAYNLSIYLLVLYGLVIISESVIRRCESRKS